MFSSSPSSSMAPAAASRPSALLRLNNIGPISRLGLAFFFAAILLALTVQPAMAQQAGRGENKRPHYQKEQPQAGQIQKKQNNRRPNDKPQYGQNNRRPSDKPQYGQNNRRPSDKPQYGQNNRRPNDKPQYGQNNRRPNDKPQYGQNNRRPNDKPQYGQNNRRPNDKAQYGQNNRRPNDKPQYKQNGGRPIYKSGLSRDRARELAHFGGHRYNYKPLSAKARRHLRPGRPIPDYVEVRHAPPVLIERLPRYSDCEWRIAGTDLLLVAAGTLIIHEIIENVFYY